MRNLNLLDMYRLRTKQVMERFGWFGDHTCGAFLIPSHEDGHPLFIIASTGEGWDHVSVSRADRCPSWNEMDNIKRRFFLSNETAMQLHVPPVEHIDCCGSCLHLWRPNDGREIPRPPANMVGNVEVTHG